MLTDILAWLGAFVINFISSTGYFGVFVLMALESACIPIPSEVIMPFAGYLVFTGRFSLWIVVLLGALGNVFGSVLAYYAGSYTGRRLIEKYGKYLLISIHDLDLADNWFKKYGQSAVFFSRLLPVIRTFISFPAGIAKMNFKKFLIFSFCGSLPWSVALAYVGVKMGENWDVLRVYFHKADYLIAGLCVIGIIWWIKRHVKAAQSAS